MDRYIGKLLDNRYEILEVIGTGGMAVVYKALCHRLNRMVAVKVLKSELALDAEFRRRFHDESQAVAMLSHPNIVAVYDVSRSSELEYIVMELIDGITLKQYMQKKGAPLNWREALHFITQIMKALSHAHGRGIIHRDIKPQNIMVLRDGSVKVADFGIARLASAAQNTLTQEALGSVHYISPEQARGSRIDARADIYSAGVVLYEMLTGRLPYEGDSPVSVAIQHINSIPLAPREINPEIPEALEAITLKAMASNVDRRYKNTDEMLNDLEEFRKNPSINFDFTSADLLAGSDEPTQVIEASGSLGRRRAVRLTEEENGEEKADVPQKKSNKSVPLAVGAILLFVFGIGFFLWLSFFSGFFQTTPEYTVPDLVWKTLSEVQGDSQITGVFTIEQGEVTYSDQYDEGVIVSQTPEAGSKLKGDNRTITVNISGGKEYVTMIDVSNLSYRDALIKLQELGLVVPTPEYQTSSTITKGFVISYTPLEGTSMRPGEEVHLVVSLGPEVKSVTVPSFVGQSLDDARKLLGDLNLKEGSSVFEVTSDKPVGTVIYQSVPAGSKVDEGSTISFQVSKGSGSSGDGTSPSPDVTSSAQPTSYTKKIKVVLPDDKDSVRVRVEVDGVVNFDNVVYRQNSGIIYPAVTGTGVQQISVYFDDVLNESYPLDFSKASQ